MVGKKKTKMFLTMWLCWFLRYDMFSDRRGFLSDTCQKDFRAYQECQHKTQNRKCWNISKHPVWLHVERHVGQLLNAKGWRWQLRGGERFSGWDVYLAYLDGVAEQSAEVGIFLVPGQIILQTAKWNILHDQLISLTTYKQTHTQKQWENDSHWALRHQQVLCLYLSFSETLI